ALPLIDDACKAEADLIELRLDYLDDIGDFKSVTSYARDLGIPVIATIRSRSHGGFWKRSERSRIKLMEEAAHLGVEYIDVERDTMDIERIVEKLKSIGVKVIVSHHDFDGTPGLYILTSLFESMKGTGCDICKIAVYARSWEDSLLLLTFTVNASKRGKVVCVSMGRFGLPARILAPLYGSEYTYASLSYEQQTAPDQIPIDRLRQVYTALGL
ncbi:MAG: type I 3-dehydroquinate dehydratase, partial [Candidatus Bathyarchaeota archaeon]|nr:type I 3-dehydroquinate dehydratase [Candidatus Bathyarchaeota archaeon]